MIVAVLGALFGVGLWCLVRALLVPPIPLGDALAHLERPRRVDLDRQHRVVAGGSSSVGRWIRSLTDVDLHTMEADLAVLERTDETHLLERVKTAAFYAVLPPVFWGIIIAITGTMVVSPPVLVVATVVAGAGGWLLTDAQVRTRAAARRREFDAALVTYLALVSILLAGGAGVQQALHDGVAQGRGWSFAVLRRALTDARVRGVSPWEAFDEHGSYLGLDGLVDLAATVELAGTSGAHVRQTLTTKARAIQAHQLAAIEREATARTSAMVGPTGLMLVGFVVLIIYPAFQAVLSI
ncbi:MAG: type II secretion system F family protein [Actinomycetota bacterium]